MHNWKQQRCSKTTQGLASAAQRQTSSRTWSQLWSFHPRKGWGVRRGAAQLQGEKSLSGLPVDPPVASAHSSCSVSNPWML